MDPIPPEAYLDAFPPPIAALGAELRRAVRLAVPDAVERVRPGWHLIGYEVPNGRRHAYFGYVAPETAHIHLGFEHGHVMRDPEGRLEGAGKTRQVRWITFRPGDAVDAAALAPLIREAVRVACLTRDERFAAAMAGEAAAAQTAATGRAGGAGATRTAVSRR
jgi:hypothetical protein